MEVKVKVLTKYLLGLAALIFLTSCGGDEETKPGVLNASDFSVILESPLENGDEVGQIKVSTTESSVEFMLTSQSPAGAINVDASTGALTVANIDLFDFENDGMITGVVEVRSGDLSDEAMFELSLSSLTAYELNVIDYFKDIALGFEFGGASEITRRWESEMRIFVGGTPPDYLFAELEDIVEEINELTTITSFSARFVDNASESNYYVYFGSAELYAARFPEVGNLAESNWGLFYIYWNGSSQLTNGHMYVDIFRANNQEQRHLLREELTQSLGLAKDSNQYSESIFQQAFSTKTTQYAQIDEDLIRLLYHPDMRTGLSESQVDAVLREIIKSW